MKTLLKMIAFFFAVIWLLPKACEYVPNFNHVLNYANMQPQSRYRQELPPPEPPKYNKGVLKQILEVAFIEQKYSVTIDTIVNVEKDYNSIFFGNVWNSETTARIRKQYVETLKAGYKMPDAMFEVYAPDLFTVVIYLPEPQILSSESDLKETQLQVKQSDMQHTVFKNMKYITSKQRDEIRLKAKQLIRNKAISEGILQATETRAKQMLTSFIKEQNNHNNKLIVEFKTY